MSSLTEAQIEELRQQLQARHEALRREISEELLRYDEEDYADVVGRVLDTGEQSVADLVVDLNLARIDQQVQELRRVEAALRRIAEGTYGICEECGGDISFERLRVQPTALRDVECQRRVEQTYAREGVRPAKL